MFFALTPELRNMLRCAYLLARKRNSALYLVGGYLRDLILKRSKANPDLDFCIERGAIAFGRQLSKRLKAGFVVLDKERGTCRLVKKAAGKVYTLDFTDFRGADLKEDLLHRDFTINALALPLEDLICGKKIKHSPLDYYGGISDLKKGIIRALGENSFDEDTLRILRAFSLAAIFGFKIDALTLRLIRRKRAKLQGVSCERIRDELFKILDQPDSFRYIADLDRFKILGLIIPEIELMRGVRQGPYHHLDVWKHSLEALRQLEDLIRSTKGIRDIQGYLGEVISAQRARRALLKLAALVHDIGKPRAKRRKKGRMLFHGHERMGREIAGDIVRRLKLANDEIDSLRRMVFWHLRPGYLADNQRPTPRAVFRYFRDAARESVSILLISIADQRATRGRLTSVRSRIRHEKISFDLIKEYFRREKQLKPPRLINGNDLMRALGLPPSPLIGEMLREVEELQAIGKLKNKSQALGLAKRLLRVKRAGLDKAR